MELEWPSGIRGARRRDESRLVGDELGEEHELAFLLAAYVAEWELDSGRGGDRLHETATELCDVLLERATG